MNINSKMLKTCCLEMFFIARLRKLGKILQKYERETTKSEPKEFSPSGLKGNRKPQAELVIIVHQIDWNEFSIG